MAPRIPVHTFSGSRVQARAIKDFKAKRFEVGRSSSVLVADCKDIDELATDLCGSLTSSPGESLALSSGTVIAESD